MILFAYYNIRNVEHENRINGVLAGLIDGTIVSAAYALMTVIL